jgi:hypothetical protein
MIGGFPAHIEVFRTSRLGEQRRPGLPLWWGNAPYVPNYYPSEFAVPYDLPSYAYPTTEYFSTRPRAVVASPAECRTDIRKVPSETGDEHAINITRCY